MTLRLSITLTTLLALAIVPALSRQGLAATEEVKTIAGVPVTGSGGACAWIRNIDGYAPIDDRHVIVSGRGGDRWLVQTAPTVGLGAPFSLGIGIQSRDDRFCGRSTDKMVVDGEPALVTGMWPIVPEDERRAAEEGGPDGWELSSAGGD